MQIQAGEVEYKRQVGKLGSLPVFEIGLRGGLHLIVVPRGKKLEPLGAGPHRAVARHIALKQSDDKIEYTDLSKADWVGPEHFLDVLPRYEALTRRLRGE